MRKEKSPYDKYPLYHYMWENAFTGNPANLLKISTLPYTCESYAEKHPESPLYHELMALSAFLDAEPGSSAYKERFQQRFSSPAALSQALRRKITDWMLEHPNDMEILCIQAAMELVAGAQGNAASARAWLIRIMTEVTDIGQFSCSRLWQVAAQSCTLWNYLGVIDKEDQRKIWEEADKITLRDVIMAWVFVPYPLVVTSITLAICSGEGYINALYPLLGIVVIALLSLVAFPYLFHKPLKKTLCATGIWAHYLGFLLKTEGGSLPLSVAWRLFLEQDFSRSIQVAGLSIWILVMLAVAWQIIVALYRTVRFLVKR